MKKIIFGAAAILVLGLTGCNRKFYRELNNWTYTNPKKDDARYTVYQNGWEFPVHHLKCVYWSTDDDDSVFEAENGKRVYVNGSSIVVEE